MNCAYGREEIVFRARQWIGTPYKHQASLKGVGADCLGLIRGIFRELEGVEPEEPPAYSSDWAEISGPSGIIEETMALAARRHLREAPICALEIGDVLLFRVSPRSAAKHAAIMSNKNRMIHACSGRAVAEVAFEPWWQRRLTYVFHFPGIETKWLQ